MGQKPIKTKKTLAILLLTSFLAILGCQKEDNMAPKEESVNKSPVTSKYVSSGDIPEIVDLMRPKSGKTSKSALVSTPMGTVEIEDILQVVDTLGNNNYSFLVFPETPRPNSIFNLVVSTSDGKDGPDMAILEYRMDDGFAQAYHNGTKDFSTFTGTIYKYPFDPQSGLLAKSTCVQNIDEIVICEEVSFTNGTTGGSGGTGGNSSGGGGTGDPGGSGSNTGSQTDIDVYWLCNWRGQHHHGGPSSCNNPGAGGTWIVIILPKPPSHTSKGSPYAGKELTCCDDAYVEGSVGINLMANAISEITNCLGTIDASDIPALSATLQTMQLKNFLAANQCSAEAKAFGLAAKNAIVHGGEVDWEDKIINELTGKAKCVYEKLQETNGNLFKSTIGKFIDDPKYNLILEIGNCPNTDVACTDGSKVDVNGDITIIIEDVTQPILELAATILHEGIHAEIYRYVSRYENNLDPNNRARIFQLYQYYKGLTNVKTYTGDPVTDAQHVYMAENYVGPIASAIRQLDNNRYPLEYYMWYGWEGLEGEDFQNRLTPELSTQYNNFQETVNGTTIFKCD